VLAVGFHPDARRQHMVQKMQVPVRAEQWAHVATAETELQSGGFHPFPCPIRSTFNSPLTKVASRKISIML
jgi:hypothetical protein